MTFGGPAPTAKRSKATLVFAILAVLFLLTTGAVTGFYFIDKGKTNRTIADQRAQIASLRQDAADQARELTKAKDDLATAEDELTSTKSEVTRLTTCQKAVQDFFAAAQKNDDAATERAVLAVAARCDGLGQG